MGECLLSFSLRFYASHKLSSPLLDERRNREVFGKCANPSGHGHDYLVWITLKGRPAPESGLLMPREQMISAARRVLEPLMDCQNLNLQLGEGVITTGENIVEILWEKLKDKFLPCTLHRVLLQETEKNFFAYYGP